MKIGILTHYNVSSHGALLQMYALKEELKRRGHEAVVLTYNKNMDFIDDETRKRYSAGIKNIPYYLKAYAGSGGIPLLMYQYKKQKILQKFRRREFVFLPYTGSGGLDAVIIGADEVFSLENGVNIMMFGHGITPGRIVSYAPSFGQTDITRIEKFGCRELIAGGLHKFSALSVRDEGSQQTVKDLIGSLPQIVCDPALLHDFGHFDKTSRKKYIVVYSYQSNFKEKERICAIREFAWKRHCELWSLGVYYKWCHKKINCDPLEMLGVFAKALYVITDTFHGTISSYIARTPMAVFVRENNNVKLDCLLKLLGLTDRKVRDLRQLESILSKEIDFDDIDKKVMAMRKAGAEYLDRSLGGKQG